MEHKLDNLGPQGFKARLRDSLAQVAAAGRQAGGTDPPEHFQIHIGAYIPFFYETNPQGQPDRACDKVHRAWFRSGGYLTWDLRHRLNSLTSKANDAIKAVADEAQNSNVFYVDSCVESYAPHTFCYPAPPAYLSSPITTDTWFWHTDSNWAAGGEGPRPPSSAEYTGPYELSLQEQILGLLLPNESQEIAFTENFVEQNFPTWYNGG